MNRPAEDMSELIGLLLDGNTSLLVVNDDFQLLRQHGPAVANAVVSANGSERVDLLQLIVEADRNRVQSIIDAAREAATWNVSTMVRLASEGTPRLARLRIDDLRSVPGGCALVIRIQDLTQKELRSGLLKSHARIVGALGRCPLPELGDEIGRQIEHAARETIADRVELALTAPSGRGYTWTWNRADGITRNELPRSGFATIPKHAPAMLPARVWRRSTDGEQDPMPLSMNRAGCEIVIELVESWGAGLRTSFMVGSAADLSSANLDVAIEGLGWMLQAFQQGLLRFGSDAVTTAERHRAELIFSRLSDFVLVWAPDGRLMFATPSFVSAIGADARDVAELRIDDLVVGGRDTFGRALHLDPGATGPIEQWQLHAADKVITIEVVTTNLCHDEHLSGYLTAGRDITHRLLENERSTRRDGLSAVIASISSRFVNATTASTSANIRRALVDISKVCPVERVLVWQRLEDGKLHVTHEHTGVGVPALGNTAPAIDAATLPELLTTALEGQPELCVANGHGSAFITATEAAVPNRLGAILAVGLRGENGPIGMLTFSAAYDGTGSIPGLAELQAEDTQTTLQTVGELFASVLNRAAAQEALTYSASHDALTGLANRSLLLERAERMLKTAHRRGNGLGLLFLDLDDFKTVNDTLGHDAGDELLKDVGDRLKRLASGSTVVARLGGDEFVMLIEGSDPQRAVTRMAGQITTELSRLFSIRGRQLSVRASIGAVTVAPGSSSEHQPGDLVRRADMAMYQAKRRGGSSFELFSDWLEEQVHRKFNLHEELREAIESDQLELWYQPQVKLSTGEIIGCEALVRWRHPVKGVVLPNEFIGVAEQAGLIGALGSWVFKQAAETAHALIAADLVGEAFTIAVNVSPLQLVDDTLVADFKALANHAGVSPTRLKIELTESTLAERDRVIPNLESLRSAGFRTSIDDFGTGFSSLSYLRDLPLDELKIDRTFVKSLGEDRRDLDMVWALVEMAHSLGLEVVAEGVETELQRDLLENMGCNVGQGWLFAKAMPRAELMSMLRDAGAQKLLPSSVAS